MRSIRMCKNNYDQQVQLLFGQHMVTFTTLKMDILHLAIIYIYLQSLLFQDKKNRRHQERLLVNVNRRYIGIFCTMVS